MPPLYRMTKMFYTMNHVLLQKAGVDSPSKLLLFTIIIESIHKHHHKHHQEKPMEISRDAIAEKYLESIPYTLYPVQEEALLAWFSSEQGVMVCAPTGTGKTLIAEAAVFEALTTGKRMYYTTPLIALTDQKFRELRESAERWGFSPDDVGLVTGNHKVNPGAKILVVVAEILFNRLLHPEEFDDFQDVQSVVMDEFHNFNDWERGIVWEFSLALLPKHVRLLLLSATVGNAVQFGNWLEFEHGHKLEVVQSDDRKVPLVFQWVGDQTLVEQIQWMCLGKEEERMTPALVFCFNRDECWRVAEEIRGKELVTPEVKSRLVSEIARFDWSQGAGPKLKQLLVRGVGVHHAGILPKYRRVVEYLFQQKLLAVCTCTETLSAGINLPARSVVLPSIMKGPAGKQTMLEAGSAHQIFGRAGRPQYDTQGHVFVLAHEDDVSILRWQEKFNRLPADSKDPKVLAEKKALKKKQPKRNPNLQYWNEAQFIKLKNAPAGNLESRGLVPWRLLAYMLKASPQVERLRDLVKKRLIFGRKAETAQNDLERMIATLWSAGYVTLQPDPPAEWFPSLPRPDREPEVVDAPILPEADAILAGADTLNSTHVSSSAASAGGTSSGENSSCGTSSDENSASKIAQNTQNEEGLSREKVLEIPRDARTPKGTPSLEVWRRMAPKNAETLTLNVPPAAKKHVSKPKITGFGAGLFEEGDFPGKTDETSKNASKNEPISLLDFGKKAAQKKHTAGDASFSHKKIGSGFGSGLFEESATVGSTETEEKLPTPETNGTNEKNEKNENSEQNRDSAKNTEPQTPPQVEKLQAVSASELLQGLTFGGGVTSSKPRTAQAVPSAKSAPTTQTPQPTLTNQPTPTAQTVQPTHPENGTGIKTTETDSETLPKSALKTENSEASSKPYTFVNGIAVLTSSIVKPEEEEKPLYVPELAIPTETMESMAKLRGVHPIYGCFLLKYLPHADRKERLQAFESILELPSSLGPSIRVPYQEDLPRGRLACGYLDPKLLELGLATEGELISLTPEERKKRREAGLDPIYTLTFADKLYRLFQHEYPLVSDLRVWPCWAAGELIRFNGKFNTYIGAKGLQKQEGMIFRHALRLILLLGEFLELEIPSGNPEEWKADLSEVVEILTKACEAADPSGTRQMLEEGLR